ncbi:MAG: DUF4249 domain-containing protein [Bacteroidales bacterium]|nr:DUF4249 domain-containing protein [Bacteroidales bacterium]
MIRLKQLIWYIWILSLPGCVEEYFPDLNKYENLLVVDGRITNDPGPYIIKLSQSSEVRQGWWIPLGGATIELMDDLGNSEILTETEEGTYSTAPDGMQGKVGRQYRIEIETANGKKYNSPFETLRKPVEIDSVYTQFEYHPNEEGSYEYAGLQFYLDTKPAEQDTNYLMWSSTATYIYEADFKIRFIFEGSLEPFPDPDSLKTCYVTSRVPTVFTSGTADLVAPVIKHFPLHYVSSETRELSVRYSVLVNQLTLGRNAWMFWDQVREQNENQEGLYTIQPYQIQGNITCISDPEEPVLGQFTVAGIHKKRIFRNRSDLPVIFRYPVCEISEGDIENFSTIFLYPSYSWPVYATTTVDGVPALPPQVCMDCRETGGTIEKPDFWVDN